MLRHAKAHKLDAALVKQIRRVGGEALARDEHGLVAEVRSGVEERLGDEDCSCATVRRGAALEFRERRVDHGRLEDLVEGVLVAELGVGVFGAVKMVDPANFGKVFCFGTVSFVRGVRLGSAGAGGGLTFPCTRVPRCRRVVLRRER